MFLISRITKDPLVRKAEIIQAAQELFLTVGYQQTAVQDIVRKVQVAQGTFYYYFSSKEAVLEAIAAEEVRKMTSFLQTPATEALPPFERLKVFIRSFYHMCYQGELGRISNRLYQENQGLLINKLWRQTQETTNSLLLPLLEQCHTDGAIRVAHPHETLGFLNGIIAILLESVLPWKYGHETDPILVENKRKIAEKLLDTLFEAEPGSFRLQTEAAEAAWKETAAKVTT